MGLKQGLNVPSNLDPCFLKEDIGFQWIVIIELLIYWNCPQIFVLLFFLFLSLLYFSLILSIPSPFCSLCIELCFNWYYRLLFSLTRFSWKYCSRSVHHTKKKIEKHRRLKFVEVLPRTTMKKLTDTTKHWQLLYLMI